MRWLLLALCPCAVAAQDVETTVSGAWLLRCVADRCEAAAPVRAVAGGPVIAQIAVGASSLVITAPVNVALRPGADLQIGDMTLNITYSRCDLDVCVADTALSPVERDAVITSDALEMTLYNIDGTAQSFSIPMDGLSSVAGRLLP